MTPRTLLSVGLGCDRGTPLATVQTCLHEALAQLGATPADIVAVARDASPAEVLDPQRWAPVAAGPVAGPVDHWWADRGTELAGDVDALEDSRRRSLAATVSEDVWREAGFDRPLQASFGVVEDDTVLAASVVTALWGWPLDVGVVVRPDARGRGLGRRVAQAALAAAVGLSGFAAFRVDRGNPAAQRIAAGLGLDEEETFHTGLAGLFHDYGKINPRFQSITMKNTLRKWTVIDCLEGTNHSMLSAALPPDCSCFSG